MYLWRRSHNDIRWRCKMNLSGHVKEDCRFASKLEQQRRKNGIVKTAGSCLKMAENAASRYLISSCQATKHSTWLNASLRRRELNLGVARLAQDGIEDTTTHCRARRS